MNRGYNLSTLVYCCLWISPVTAFFLLTKSTRGEQKVSAAYAYLFIPISPVHDPPFFSLFVFQYISVSSERTCKSMRFISFSFRFVFLPFFHLISSRVNTNSFHPESVRCSAVHHFFSVCILSFAQVKPLSELDFKVKAAVVVWDSELQQIVHVRTFTGATHIQSVGLTPTPPRTHTWQTSTWSSFIVSCHHCFFYVAICFFPQ